MKIIFLDIDGVLNNIHSLQYGEPADDLDINNVNILLEILKITNADIVLSSSWRYNMDTVYKLFNKYKIPKPIDRTIIYKDYKKEGLNIKAEIDRGYEILHWVNKHNPEHWVVIDDDIFDLNLEPIKDKLVVTSFNTGLTQDHIKKVIEILDKK